MPIHPDNKHRYPADWPAIRASVLSDARYRCEWPGCGAKHHAAGHWRHGIFLPMAGKAGRAELTYRMAKIAAMNQEMHCPVGRKYIVIVLTIAHLDHQPENCHRSNLRAWCQRHHLAYDAKHHAQSAYMRRREARNTLELPL